MNNPLTISAITPAQETISSAARVLANRFGRSPALTDWVNLGGNRSGVFSCRVEGLDDGPERVVVKHALAMDGERCGASSAQGPARRLFNDWAGHAFLMERSADAVQLAPTLYGGDSEYGLIVLEEVAQGRPTLANVLLADDRSAAEGALVGYYQALGQMHAQTAAHGKRMDQLRAELGPGDNRFYNHGMCRRSEDALRQIALTFDVSLATGWEADHRSVFESLYGPGPFDGMVHGDPCPGNGILCEDRVMILDFETCCRGNVLIDAAFPRAIFPTCTHASRLPPDVLNRIEQAYRHEVVGVFPEIGDDRLFYSALADVVVALTLGYLVFVMPRVMTEDWLEGASSKRQRLLARIEAATEVCTRHRCRPALRDSLAQLHQGLRARWSDLKPMPFYPAIKDPKPREPIDIGIQRSIHRRVATAGRLNHFFDAVGTAKPLARFARRRAWHVRIPNQAARMLCDASEWLRTGGQVPAFGDVERIAWSDGPRLPQYSGYRGYWYDPDRNAAVGLMVGVDVIPRDGRFYVVENNQGPSMYDKRRPLYSEPFDPVVSGVVRIAKQHGFSKIVPIALHWPDYLLQEFARTESAFGMPSEPLCCPIAFSGSERIVSLPKKLERDTFYFVMSGLHTPVSRYLDNKYTTQNWLNRALREELPSDTLVAQPRTLEALPECLIDNGPGWPNLVVKLANSSSGFHVLTGRFKDAEQARDLLKIDQTSTPRQLQAGLLLRRMTEGGDRVLFQDFVPPDLDPRGHARIARVHMLVAPFGTSFLSSHYRMARTPAPKILGEGLIGPEVPVLVNDGDYARVPEDVEQKLRSFADDFGGTMRRAVERSFEVRPR